MKVRRNEFMDRKTLQSNLLLLLTATIWGFAFVAQRVGMDFLGPFTFNGVRFALGSLSLIPLILITDMRAGKRGVRVSGKETKVLLWGGTAAGFAIFAGVSFQQVGLVYTTAGKAGFITGLYVVIVPIMGLLWKQKADLGTWMGAFLAAVGLYFLSVTEAFTISFGDFLEIIGAFFWAGHLLIIGWLSRRANVIKLAFLQYAVCSALSMTTAFIVEDVSIQGIIAGAVPLFYGGVCSVGIAYTLQVVAQKNAKAAHAAIILSMESPFAALGGWLLLNEILTGRSFFGCMLMLGGMLVSQLSPLIKRSSGSLKTAEESA
jgi:drug/metabolite transporter (DMT)-like permease